ncbi:MAG: ACT domain-containing protein [Candidatus Marsarchaeota archaeon]|nr:ACT domain-containing protein [Candidatus Marsarchaeota archaeon]
MNIGIDFDGTISDNPGFFRELAGALTGADNRIYIISSYTSADADRADAVAMEKRRMLREWGIRYSELELVGEPIPDNKAAYCKDHDIKLMIDDLEENLSRIRETAKGTVCLLYIGR